MNLLTATLTGAPGVATLIQNYMFSPSVAGVSIFTKSNKETLSNDVSEQMIIDASKGKLYQTDNIVPKPRTWQITGWLKANILEIVCLSPILQPSLLDQKQRLRAARNSRATVDFIPLNKEEIGLKVAIKDLAFDTDAETMNAIPVTITLQEAPVLSIGADSSSTGGLPSGLTNPAADPVDVGVAPAVAGSLALSGFT